MRIRDSKSCRWDNAIPSWTLPERQQSLIPIPVAILKFMNYLLNQIAKNKSIEIRN